ncbi:MAG: methyltransferase domain-containing protein [Candidatus Eisenbacteria bacterium]
MDAHHVLEETLEKRLLSVELRPAKPIGLRYDRLAREGFCFTRGLSGGAYWYHFCNGLALSGRLLNAHRVLLLCEEDWWADIPGMLDKDVTRVVLTVRPTHDGPHLEPVESAAESPGKSSVEACTEPSVEPVESAVKLPTDTITVSDFGRLPLEARSFDTVVADSSILLGGDLSVCASELGRVLPPGGSLCLISANWEYEMAGKSLGYETSFKRYLGNVYLGLVKRTLSPPKETEYVCRLDSRASLSRRLALLPREKLGALALADVPGAIEHVVSAEIIEIPQVTRSSLEQVLREAGFDDPVVGGAPGTLAMRLSDATARLLLATESGCASGVGHSSSPAAHRASGAASCDSRAPLMKEACAWLAPAFPFVDSAESPHLVSISVRG